MHSKRILFLALPVVVALAAAGIAVAASSGPSIGSVTATLSATSVSRAHTASCTPTKGGDTYKSTTATYKGTATSTDARFDGTLKIRAHSFVDTTSGLGDVSGTYNIVGKGKAGASGTFVAAVSNGTASGLARGVTTGPTGQLIASLGATFDPAKGFSGGAIGSPTTTGSGVVISHGYCPTKKK